MSEEQIAAVDALRLPPIYGIHAGVNGRYDGHTASPREACHLVKSMNTARDGKGMKQQYYRSKAKPATLTPMVGSASVNDANDKNDDDDDEEEGGITFVTASTEKSPRRTPVEKQKNEFYPPNPTVSPGNKASNKVWRIEALEGVTPGSPVGDWTPRTFEEQLTPFDARDLPPPPVPTAKNTKEALGTELDGQLDQVTAFIERENLTELYTALLLEHLEFNPAPEEAPKKEKKKAPAKKGKNKKAKTCVCEAAPVPVYQAEVGGVSMCVGVCVTLASTVAHCGDVIPLNHNGVPIMTNPIRPSMRPPKPEELEDDEKSKKKGKKKK